jgi:hypothetical protein
MSDWEQTREKLAAEQQMKERLANMCPSGETIDRGSRPGRPSLRERVTMQLRDAQEQSYKRDRLQELEHLLDKHKEIARILDLLENVRG